MLIWFFSLVIIGELLLFLFLYHLHFLRWLDLREQERVTEDSSPFYAGASPMLKTFLREMIAYHVMILFHLLSPFYVALMRSSTEKKHEHYKKDSEKADDFYTFPLVFVHGWGGRSSNFLWLASKLRQKIRCRSYFYSYSSLALSIEESAAGLLEFCNRIQQEGNSDRVVLICHSMGGLVARELLASNGMKDRIAGIVTLGSPHHGTKLAYCGVSRSGRQMSPWSNFITRMASHETELDNVPHVQVWSPADAAIVPASSACLQEAATNVSLHCGHVEMLLRREIVQILLDFLPRLEESDPP